MQVTVYHLLKLFQSETDVMLGKKSLVAEYYDEMVGEHVVGMFCGEFVYDRLHPRLLMPKKLEDRKHTTQWYHVSVYVEDHDW